MMYPMISGVEELRGELRVGYSEFMPPSMLD